METINVIRPVTVKVKVTEDFKEKMQIELAQQIDRLENELQQIEFQGKRMTLELDKNPYGVTQAKQKLEVEKQRRIEAKTRLKDQLNNMDNIAIGSEILNGTIQSLVEVKIGDDWEKMLGTEVIVEDGKVIEIREGNTY